jgi:hypothetical protein
VAKVFVTWEDAIAIQVFKAQCVSQKWVLGVRMSAMDMDHVSSVLVFVIQDMKVMTAVY